MHAVQSDLRSDGRQPEPRKVYQRDAVPERHRVQRDAVLRSLFTRLCSEELHQHAELVYAERNLRHDDRSMYGGEQRHLHRRRRLSERQVLRHADEHVPSRLPHERGLRERCLRSDPYLPSTGGRRLRTVHGGRGLPGEHAMRGGARPLLRTMLLGVDAAVHHESHGDVRLRQLLLPPLSDGSRNLRRVGPITTSVPYGASGPTTSRGSGETRHSDRGPRGSPGAAETRACSGTL